MRNSGLDVVRGLAVLIVLGAHNFNSGQGDDIFIHFANFYHRIGWVGVDLFFVLELLTDDAKETNSIPHKTGTRNAERRKSQVGKIYGALHHESHGSKIGPY